MSKIYEKFDIYFDSALDINKDIDSISGLSLVKKIRVNTDRFNFLNLCEHINNIDISDPVFCVDQCYLWNGLIKGSKKYKSPWVQDCNVKRHIFQICYNIKLSSSEVLRHMCPVLLGEFNTGMCVNPLHMTIGTQKQNMRDKFVHQLFFDILNSNFIDYFCFKHNTHAFDYYKYLHLFEKNALDKLVEKRTCKVDYDTCRCTSCSSTFARIYENPQPCSFEENCMDIIIPESKIQFDFNIEDKISVTPKKKKEKIIKKKKEKLELTMQEMLDIDIDFTINEVFKDDIDWNLMNQNNKSNCV